MRYFTDFRNETVGVTPADIASVWADLTIETEAGNALSGSDRSLLLSNPLGEGFNFTRAAAAWTPDGLVIDNQTTVQIFCEFTTRVDGGATLTVPGAFVSGSGDNASRTGYVYHYKENSAISKYENGSDSAVETGTNVPPNDAIQRRLEISRNGSNIEVRAWADGDPRPAAAALSYSDGSPLPVGSFAGVSAVLRSDTPMRVFSIEIATNGDSPTGEPTDSITLPASATPTTTINAVLSGDVTATSATLSDGTATVAQTLGAKSYDAGADETTYPVTIVRGNMTYGDARTLTITLDDTSTVAGTTNLAPAANWKTITTLNPSTELGSFFYEHEGGAPVDGMQVHYDGEFVTLGADGIPTEITGTMPQDVQAEVWRPGSGTWSAMSTVTLYDAEAEPEPEPEPGEGGITRRTFTRRALTSRSLTRRSMTR